MKKVSLFMVMIVISFSLFAQFKVESKPDVEPMSDDIVALQTAINLAKYGYKTQSASALIGAAEILAQIQTQPLDAKAERNSQTGSTTVDTPEFTPENLLKDARKIAGRDKTMIAWADEVQKLLNSKTRGAVGGPKSTRDIVYGGGENLYTVTLKKGERTYISISGNGASNLDLYVFDIYGNLIIGDEHWSDTASVWLVPAVTTDFIILVINRGINANRFDLWVK